MHAKDMRQAILDELEHQDATVPERAVDPIAVPQSLGVLEHDFEVALAELADPERVGLVTGQLYLRRNSP